jgi:hypothetical protein
VIRQLRDEGEMAIMLVEQYFDFAFDLRGPLLRRHRREPGVALPSCRDAAECVC